MSTVQELVNAALSALSFLDINETDPSPTVMTRSISILERMIADWEAKDLLLTAQTISGRSVAGEYVIYDLASTNKIRPGFKATGTGITGRINTVDTTTRVTLDTVATASNTVDILFEALPFPPKFERSVVALLAMDLAPACQMGESEIPAWVQRAAIEGWSALSANYMRVAEITYDTDLILTSALRDVGVLGNG